MSPLLRSFALATLLVTAGFFAVSLGQGTSDRSSFEERAALRLARAVAFVASEEQAGTDETTGGVTQRFVAELPRVLPVIQDAVVVKGAKLLASADPARAGQRLDPESLTDKVLYDDAASIKAAVAKNAEERERRPDLVRDAYAEVKADRSADGIVTVGVPVKSDGRFVAMARVRARPEAPSLGLPFLMLAVFAVALLLFGLVERSVKGWPGVAIGAVVLLGVLAADIHVAASGRADQRREEAEIEAALYAKLATAGLLSAVPTDRRDALLASLRLDGVGLDRPDLVAIRSATVAAAPLLHTLKLDLPPYEVHYAASYFEGQWEADVSHLLQWGAAFFLVSTLMLVLGASGQLKRGWTSLVKHRQPYYYMVPAMTGMAILVFIPVAFGIVLGFLDRRYNIYEFAGLSNYVGILSSFDFSNPQNFYFKLGVTVMWTVVNVTLHVSIGLFLALLLNDQMLKARGVYRVLLIVPWAIPNYITALVWQGLFHKQFGAINIVLETLGAEPIGWFQSFWPAFTANVATNTWLGFPFMMVVSLGALQSIPGDLYEAAWVDGASRWQRFVRITLPLLMPALVPAVIMGVVWTFNMFNIIYLVSGGAPNGATDILITDAFRWAFERDRYGYAAAYSTLIFLILLTFTVATNRITGATKGVFE